MFNWGRSLPTKEKSNEDDVHEDPDAPPRDPSSSSSSQNTPKDDPEKPAKVPRSLQYNTVRQAVDSEQALMKLIVNMPEEDFNKLITASETYMKVAREGSRNQRDIALSEERKAKIEAQKFIEEQSTIREKQKQEAKLRELRVKEEELRKTERLKTEEKKKRIDYEAQKQTEEEIKREQARLETRREFDRMDRDSLREKERLEQQRHERKKDLIKLELAEKARQKKELEKELAPLRLQQSLKEHEAKKADILLKEKELKKIEMDASVQKETIRWEKLSNFFTGEEGKERMWNMGGLVIGSIGALYFFKTVQPLAERGLRDYFFKPTLVSRAITYHNTPVARAFHRAKSLFVKPVPLPDVILEPHLQQKMNWVIEGTKNTSKRGGYFGHMMMYGKPGTGKTLFAEKLARESNMDFAIMSGPSFDQFSPQEAIVEIKKLFKWANNSRHGLLLFVDEADSFLEDRSTLHPSRVAVLNEWLNQTGTESRKFMCVYETNRPEVLDPAVQSRITRSVEMPPPHAPEIQLMLEQYLSLYVLRDNKLRIPRISEALQKEGDVKEAKEEDSVVTTTTTSTSESGTETETDSDSTQISKEDLAFAAKRKAEIEARRKELAVFKLDLDQVAKRLAAENFVGRDVSNLCIAISQALYANKAFSLSKKLVNSVVDEQIAKKQKENAYLKNRQQRIESLKRYDTLHI